MPAEALLIAEARDPQDHRVGVLAPFEKNESVEASPRKLVLGVVQVGQELDLGHRDKAVLRHADGEAQDRLFVEKRVDHPVRPEALA